MKDKTRLFFHICFWTVKNGLEFFMSSYQYFLSEPPMVFWRNTLLLWSLYAAVFYLNYLFLIPRYLLRRKYRPYLLYLVPVSVVFFMIVSLIWNGYTLNFMQLTPHVAPAISFCWSIIIGGSTALRLLEEWVKSEKTKKLLLQEVRETELLYLKSQMSPHFLFNTFNNIYGLAINQSQQTSEALGQLKQMMLYVRNFKEGSLVSIEEEVKTLKSFISLNTLRYDCQVNFQSETSGNVLIEPMIFLPFIENAFKHGDTGKSSRIDILLRMTEDKIIFILKNQIDFLKRKDETGGIGILNIRRRLALLYGTSWSLQTVPYENFYSVHLIIDRI